MIAFYLFNFLNSFSNAFVLSIGMSVYGPSRKGINSSFVFDFYEREKEKRMVDTR